MSQGANAQYTRERQINLGYYAPFGFHPGVKVGYETSLIWPFKPSEKTVQKKDTSRILKRRFVIREEVGYFAWKNTYSAYMLSIEMGYRRSWEDGRWYGILSAGFAQVWYSEVTSFSVNLQGEITDKQRSRSIMAMPTLGSEIGRSLGNKFAMYFKLSVGRQMFVMPEIQREGRSVLLTEAGFSFRLPLKTVKPTP